MWSLEKALEISPNSSSEKDKPVIVEIGTHKAGTSNTIVRALLQNNTPAKFFTIDIDFENLDPQGRNGFYPRNEWKRMYSRFPPLGDIHAEFIEKPAAEAAKEIPDPIHWVFCDGCHCEECVVAEIESYATRIVPGGFMIMHDCGEEYRDYPPDQPYHDGNYIEGRNLRPFYVIETLEKSELINSEYELVAVSRPQMRGTKKDRTAKVPFGGAYCYQRNSK